MISIHQLFGWLTAAALLAGFWPYIRDIFKGKTKPERASWVIWGVLLAIAFFTQLSEGAKWSLVMPGLDFFIVSFIFMLSVKYGSGGLIKRDVVSLTVAVFGLVLWGITKQPLTALLIVIGIGAIATYLTLVKTFRAPSTETLFAWIMSSISGICAILAVNHLRFGLLVYPIFIFLADTSVMLTILIGRKHHKNKQKPSKDSPPIFEIP